MCENCQPIGPYVLVLKIDDMPTEALVGVASFLDNISAAVFAAAVTGK